MCYMNSSLIHTLLSVQSSQRYFIQDVYIYYYIFYYYFPKKLNLPVNQDNTVTFEIQIITGLVLGETILNNELCQPAWQIRKQMNLSANFSKFLILSWCMILHWTLFLYRAFFLSNLEAIVYSCSLCCKRNAGRIISLYQKWSSYKELNTFS